MGNTALRDLATISDVSVGELAGSTVAVDFHNWLYRYLTVVSKFTDESVYTTSGGVEVANLLGIVKGVPTFLGNDLRPAFVFDGDILDLKEAEMERRRERTEAARARLDRAKAAGDEELAARLRARTQRLTPTILETSRELLDILDLPVVDAPAEAEAQAAHMSKAGAVDYAATEDYDALLFGAPYTLRQLTGSGSPECMDLDATLADLGVSLADLVDIAILCGTDYNDGVHGVGPNTALAELSAGRTVEAILDDRGADIPDLDAIRDIYLDPGVTDRYTVDWEWNPRFDEAEAYLVGEWELPADRLDPAFERMVAAERGP